MSNTARPLYAAPVALTMTLTSMANNEGRQAAAVNNSTDLAVTSKLQLKTKTGAIVVSTGTIEIWIAESPDGTVFSDNFTDAGDAQVLAASFPVNSRLIAVLTAATASKAVISPEIDIASVCGGFVPSRWIPIVKNLSGGALSGTGSDHALTLQKIQVEIV